MSSVNVGLFIFSGTGNSYWVAERFQKLAKNYGWNVELISIANIIQNTPAEIINKIEHCEKIGLVYPIYGANLPPIVDQFLKLIKSGLSKAENSFPENNIEKDCFILATMGYVNAYGPYMINNRLNELNWKLVGHMNFRIANNASTPKLKSNIPKTETVYKRLIKVAKKIDRYLNSLTKQKIVIRGVGPWLLAGYFIRKKLTGSVKEHYKSLSVDLDRCSRCLLCQKSCPTNSISFLDDKFNFAETCTSCLRCYNLCPNQAILIGGKFANLEKHPRYQGPTDVCLSELRKLELNEQ